MKNLTLMTNFQEDENKFRRKKTNLIRSSVRIGRLANIDRNKNQKEKEL